MSPADPDTDPTEPDVADQAPPAHWAFSASAQATDPATVASF